jgi:hypothetical protein
MNEVIVIALVLATVVALVVLLTLPRWFARSIGQERMWRLRDRLVKNIWVNHELPSDHPAVVQLIEVMDRVLREGKHYTLLHVYLLDRTFGRLDQTKFQEMKENRKESLSGLTSEERIALKRYRDEFELLFAGSLLLGSWFGLLQVARFAPRVYRGQETSSAPEPSKPAPAMSVDHRRYIEQRRRSLERFEQGMQIRAQLAADQATRETRFGKRLLAWIQEVMLAKAGSLSPSNSTAVLTGPR